MIQLTDTDGLPCLIAPDDIAAVIHDVKKKGQAQPDTLVYINVEFYFRVKESPEQIKDLMDEYRNKRR